MSQQVYIYGPDFSTFVRSVKLVCEEKGISYQSGYAPEGRELKFGSQQHLEIHPFAKVPVLLHDGHHVCESSSILRYLEAAFPEPSLQPGDLWQRTLVDQWCGIVAGYIDQAIVRKYLLEFSRPKGPDGTVSLERVEAALPDLRNAIALIEEQLGHGDYLCGEQFTLADALLAPMVHYLCPLPGVEKVLSPDSNIRGYVSRVLQRESGQRVLKPFGS